MSEQVATAQPETQVSGGQDTSVSAPAAASSAPETSAPVDLDAELSAVYDKAHAETTAADKTKADIARKLAEPPTETGEEPASESTVQAQSTASEPASSPAIAAPNSWTAEAKAHWSKLPPDVQTYVAQRESQVHKAITQMGTELSRLEPTHKVIEQDIRALGVPPGREAEVIQRWAHAERALQSDPVNSIRWLMEAYGVDPAQVLNGHGKGAQPSQQDDSLNDLFKDPRFDAVQGELQQLKQQQRALVQQEYARQQAVQQYQAQQQAYALEQANSVISDFIAKPEVAKIWDLVGDEVNRQVAILKQVNPRATMQELMQEGFDKAAYANKQTREILLADQRREADAQAAKEKAAAAEKAKKMAAINQRSGSSSATQTVKGRWDDTDAMGAIYDRIVAGSR